MYRIKNWAGGGLKARQQNKYCWATSWILLIARLKEQGHEIRMS
jgi:hypothetical protein